MTDDELREEFKKLNHMNVTGLCVLIIQAAVYTLILYFALSGTAKPSVPPFNINRTEYSSQTEATADLWYDQELGRFGVVGLRSGAQYLTPEDKIRFEKWTADRARVLHIYTTIVSPGNGVIEAPVDPATCLSTNKEKK